MWVPIESKLVVSYRMIPSMTSKRVTPPSRSSTIQTEAFLIRSIA